MYFTYEVLHVFKMHALVRKRYSYLFELIENPNLFLKTSEEFVKMFKSYKYEFKTSNTKTLTVNSEIQVPDSIGFFLHFIMKKIQ